MESKLKSWIVFVLVTSWISAAVAQTAPTTEKEPPVKQTQKMEQIAKPSLITVSKVAPKNPSTSKFSLDRLESDRLDPSYTGIPIAKVVEAIEKMSGSKKGEFESTAEFNARKAAALSKKFMGDLSLDDTFAFVFPVSAHVLRSGFGYQFNADTSEVRLFVLPLESRMNGIGGPDFQIETILRKINGENLDQFDFGRKIDSRSTYTGSNAYGVTVGVEKIRSTRYGIVVKQIPFLTFKREKHIYGNPKPQVQFNLENVRAAKELPALKALVVMKLADPYVVYNYNSSKPTRDDPYDIADQSKYLTGNVLGIVFYSGITGEIFARLPESFGKPEPQVETMPEDKPVSQ